MFSGASWKSLKADSRVRALLLKHDYFIKILLRATYISLIFHTCRGFISLLCAVDIFQKKKKTHLNSKATAYVIAWLIFCS